MINLNLMKKLKKSTWVTLALLIYVSVTAALLPRNTEVSDTEKYITLAISYVIVFILWLVLRQKEKLQQRRREEEHYTNLKK